MELKELASRVAKHRGTMGIRAAAGEIGISPTTLSKIERGHIPDMKTLDKVCEWIGESAENVQTMEGVQVAFKKDAAVSEATAKSLANAIQLAYQQFADRGVKGH